MSRAWKPGDVAAWRPGGDSVAEIVFFRLGGIDYDQPGWQTVDSGEGYPREDELSPLVVIDPEDREQVEALWQAWRDLAPDHCLAQDNMQDALRSLIADPKPAEPMGLGAVVEVESVREFMRGQKVRLVRTHATHGPWFGDNTKRDWADITGPITVLSEGVTQ